MSLFALFLLASSGRAATPSSDEHKAQPGTARSQLPFGVFGSLEFATNATKGLGEWRDVTAAVDRERALYARCDEASSDCPANLLDWRASLKTWSALAGEAKLAAVNAYVNARIRYADDAAVYGVEDFWASPAKSLGRRGDCEDYAIAKYESLRALGFAERDLRLVILKDLRRGIGHAVLSVRLDGRLYILDNQKARPFLHETVAYYAPVFSINREGRWINIATRKIRSQYAIAAEEKGDPAATRPAVAETRRAIRLARLGMSDAGAGERVGAKAAALVAVPMPALGGTIPAAAAIAHVSSPWREWRALLSRLAPLARLVMPVKAATN